ncbi:MAG: Trk system potassium transporter TrkA [Clostridiales bacterium]|nr:Trk system potassium transporter TrkA [Clostridiales bacterium]
MRVVIVGCGKVGKAIIDSMAEDKHDIIAIDNDSDVIEDVTNTYDVMAVCGSATSREMLLSASVPKADLFIAVTESDEVNMLSCFLARRMGAKHTVARIRETEYNEDGLNYITKELELSMALNPERLTAETLFDQLKLPSAVSVDNFAGKKLQMLELIIKEGSPLIDVNLMDLRKKCAVQFIACVVQREDEVYIPTGAFTLQEGDKVAFMVKRSDTHKFLKSIGAVQKQGRDVIILGGSTTSYYLAKILVSNGFSVKIIERDEQRCEELAEILPAGATLIHGDGMNHDLLWEEGIKSTDAFVALTGTDEENILISFYAASQEVPKVIAKVNHAELADLAEKLGLENVVAPRKLVADALTRYARALKNTLSSKVETMYSLMDDRAEALEFAVLADCKLVGIALKDLKLKQNFIIAGIIRGKETIIPSGDDKILEGDSVIVVATDAHLYDLSDALR